MAVFLAGPSLSVLAGLTASLVSHIERQDPGTSSESQELSFFLGRDFLDVDFRALEIKSSHKGFQKHLGTW